MRSYKVYFIAAMALFFIGHRLFVAVPDVADTIVSYATYPFLVVQSYIVMPIERMMRERHEADFLQELLDDEKQRNLELQTQVYALQASLAYASGMKEVSAFTARYDGAHSIIAHILLKHIAQDEHYFFVDAGHDKGITSDMVAVFANCLVGKVTQVYPWYSKVTLLTDRSCKIAAYSDTTHIQGIHQGIQDSTQTMLGFVSHLAPVQEGELLYSSGQGLVFPQGFALGKVKRVSIDGLHCTIDVLPCIDIHSLNYCHLFKMPSSSIT